MKFKIEMRMHHDDCILQCAIVKAKTVETTPDTRGDPAGCARRRSPPNGPFLEGARVRRGGCRWHGRGRFPDYRARSGKEQEEESRNGFVVVTRSKRLLYLAKQAIPPGSSFVRW